MPIKFQPRFTRQMIPKIKKGGLVIPASAEPLASLPENVLSYINSQPPRPANSFSFHYINYPFTEDIFEDGHKINDGIYEFLLKDAVIAVYDLHSFQNDEFCWSFATTHQTVVLSALNIGKMFDVKLAQPFKKILHISKYHFPSGVPDSGYGQHALHLSVDYSTSQEKGFRILSSYEVGANKTDSRLPFFFGFRVYGFKNVGKRPIWRKFLSDAAIYAQAKDWGTALIQTAFALESFIDSVLFSIFKKADFGEYYGTHLLQVGEKNTSFMRYSINSLAKNK